MLVIHHTNDEDDSIVTTAQAKGSITPYEGHVTTTSYGQEVESVLKVSSNAATFVMYSRIYRDDLKEHFCDILSSSDKHFIKEQNSIDKNYLMDGFVR